MITATFTLEESNQQLSDFLSNDAPFFISRLSDIETKVALLIHNKMTVPPQQMAIIQNNAGIYWRTEKDLELYSRIYMNAVLKSSTIACFQNIYNNEQNICLKIKKLEKGLHSRVLEPFYLFGAHDNVPWTHKLLGKRVLIIHPFIETFKKQLAKGCSFFGDNAVFLPGQQFVFYRAYNTQAGNRTHSNWFETFSIMCKEIKAMEADFDIALLGCGGYGLPLCNYIFGLGKSALYIGGGLQLLFGVTGKRWDSHAIIGPFASAKDALWVRPAEDEIVAGHKTIEGGCYW